MADPWQYVTLDALAAAAACPRENVAETWPRLVEQLERCGINDRDVQIALAGTVAKETASQFKPVHEAFWLPDAERWAEYERRGYGGGPNYHGRGDIQVTHLGNYKALGPKIAALWGADPADPRFDLVANPDNLLDQNLSAAAAAIFFRDTRALPTVSWPAGYSLIDAAHAHDWEWVRRLVYGGRDPDGERRIAKIAAAFTGGTVATVTYNPAEPPHRQEDDFDCSQESAEWALWSVGRRPTEDWLEGTMIAEGVMTAQWGLMDATGKGLADFLNRHYGEFGYRASNEPLVTFDALASECGRYPLMIGGRNWGGPGKGHWSGLAGYDAARGVLLLKNPATGPTYGLEEMNRGQMDARGPFSMVRLTHPDLLGIVTPPPPPPPPIDEVAALRAHIAELNEKLAAERTKLGVLQAQYLPGLRDIANAIERELKPSA